MNDRVNPTHRSDVGRIVLVVLSLMVLAVGVLVATVFQGFEALSAARAYVGGEGQWSGAQKTAVYHLVRFATLGDEVEYDRFLEELDVTLGDRMARIELEKPQPDRGRVREGFLTGRNHPDDVDRMTMFFRRYRNFAVVDEAISVWAQGDQAIDSLLVLGAEIRRVRGSEGADASLPLLLVELDGLNDDLSELASRFSSVLSEGARWAQGVLFGLVVVTAALLVGLTVLLSWALAGRLARSEARLRSSEAQYRSLVEQAPLGVYRSSPDGRINEANPSLARLLGYDSPEELSFLELGRDVYVDPELRREWVSRHETPGAVFRNLETEWSRADGSSVFVSLTGRVLPDGRGGSGGYEVFVEDVTERRLLEAQLRAAQKLEAVGQLTGGIAHDFNNLLTVILSANSLLAEDLARATGETPVELGEVDRAARKGAELVAKLLAFSRKSPLAVAPVSLPHVVRDAHQTLRRLLPASIEIELRTEEDCPRVLADVGSLDQILLNLATNARDAMPGGGRLELAVEPRTLPGEDLTWAVLLVQDTGTGMPDEVLDRVFEPFYTTKPLGKGTGLGLSMVYGLAKQQGGFVEIESQPGEGTEVRIFFRPVEADALA